ncbi:ABC transporter permease [Streptomyces oryzae]|uniref:ABC transporter permease n=1 Tax=Streptomyces oryzae TaxID=1434886 RepID=A0ABS3XAN5_9ACTN|nr:ABC transporter permease [Streptomyces oryzae]
MRWTVLRLLTAAVQLLALSIVIFSVLYLTPGKPEQILLGTQAGTSPAALAAIREKYHLNEPLVNQYGLWLRDAAHFDFGRSIQTGQTVTSAISERLPVTIFLTAFALALVVLIAVPLGLIAGTRVGTFTDRLITLVITVGFSAPAFAVGIGALYVFGVILRWFPMYGAGDGFVDRLWHLSLPAATLALTVIAVIARQTRATALKTNDQDFMMFARVRGLSWHQVVGRYLLRNSSLPVVTSLGLVLAYFLTGTVIVEQTFALQGIASLLVSAIGTKDVPMVQCLALLAALFVLLSNLLTDMVCVILDPRLRRKAFA